MKKERDRTFIIVLSIIVGLLLACVMLPLGGFALLLTAASGDSTASGGVLPAQSWTEQARSGSFLAQNEKVLVLYVTGVIGLDDGGAFTSALTQDDLLSQIDQATNDPSIQAVVVRVDSPGGGVVASNELHHALTELRGAGKPLVVSMGSTAASGGYYIATAADEIYANADTFTGSLGVIITLFNYGEAFDNLGLQQTSITSGDFKDIGSPVEPLTPEDQAILQEIVDQAYDGFVDVIVEGRNLPREEVVTLADGRIYTGQQAMELGLVDELGNLDAAIARARELAGLSENALVVQYDATPDFLSLLGASLEQSQQPADPLGLRNLTTPQPPRLEYRMIGP